MLTPVQQAAVEYIAAGWKLCAINPGKKGPLYTGWNLAENAITEPHRFPLGWGVGLMHAYSGTCAVDIDNFPVARTWLLERGCDLDSFWQAEDAVRIGRGAVDRGKLLYALPKTRISIAVAPFMSTDKEGKPREKMALELRCAASTGKSVQDVLPPSIHPESGKSYEWSYGMFAHWNALPAIPPAFLALWDELQNPVLEPGTEPQVAASSGAAPAAIERWLATQDPSMSYLDWLKVGMKLHAEFQGSNEGFAVWQTWSSKSPKWDEKARQEMFPKWKGFKLEGPVLATLARDLRQMPIAPEEFQVVTATEEAASRVAADTRPESATVIAGLVLQESEEQRENRELLERLVYLSSGKPRYWLREDPERPGPPMPELDRHWGGMDADAVRNIFTPYMKAEVLEGKKTPQTPDPVQYFQRAKWKTVVRTIGFHPGAERIFRDIDGARYLNAYVNNRPRPVPMPVDVKASFHWLLDRIEGRGIADWLCNLYAHAIQFPGVKIQQAPLLYGQPGSGKSTLMYTIPCLLFGGTRYVKQVPHDQLMSRFATGPLADAWWITLNELKMAGDKKIDRSYVSEKLKPWITEPTIAIEHKGLAIYEIPNRVQITASSNHDDALHIEAAETERRWGIGCLEYPLSAKEIAQHIVPVYARPESGSWFTHYFLNYKIDRSVFNPNGRPPLTAQKQQMAEQSLGTWESRLYERMQERHPPFDKDIVSASDVQDILRGLGFPNWAKAGSLLRAPPFHAVENRTSTMRYWAWRNQALWKQLLGSEWRDYHVNGIRPHPEWDWGDPDLLGDIRA